MHSTPRARQRRSILAAVGDHLLTALAVAGSLCIVLVIAGWLFDISLMMFRTGSMSPTITAGSVAVVREIPATEMEVGDVVTVDRGEGMLPVTHRVTALEDVDGSTGEVTFTMRGDANDVEDPEPYTATEVRRVMVSVPGAARVIQWFGDPYVLGGLTLGATALVIWAFWPRDPETEEVDEETAEDAETGGEEDPTSPMSTQEGEQGTGALHAAGLPLLAGLLLTAPVAQTDTTLLTGEHLRMQTSGNAALMQNLSPGDAAVWEVGVWAEVPDPGEIRLGISGRGELAQIPDALTVSVRACEEPWVGAHCPAGPRRLLEPLSLDTIAQPAPTRILTTMPSDEQRWLRVEVQLERVPGTEGAEGDVLIHAVGAGESLSASPDPPPGDHGAPDTPRDADRGAEAVPGAEGALARTGASGVMALAGAGLLAVAGGLALWRPLRRRERS